MKIPSDQFYLAQPLQTCSEENAGQTWGYTNDLRPKEAAEYIASLLASLREIAAQAQLTLLSDLISVAEEEAKFHYRS